MSTRKRRGGTFKKCSCPKWAKCSHPWHMSFTLRKKRLRYALNDNMAAWLGLPRPVSPSEAVRVRFKVIERILNGQVPDAQDTPIPTSNRFTVDDLVQPYLDFFASQTWRGEKRRAHRVPMLKNQLLLICRTLVPAARGTTRRRRIDWSPASAPAHSRLFQSTTGPVDARNREARDWSNGFRGMWG